MAVVCLDDDCVMENPICKRQSSNISSFLFAHKLILQQKPLVGLLQTHLREIDGGCIVFTDEDWETEFHWENVLEDDFKDGTESFLDDWAVAGPLATMNFMASLYSGKRIDLRKLYDEYIPGQEHFQD